MKAVGCGELGCPHQLQSSERIAMINLLKIDYLGDRNSICFFSDGSEAVFDLKPYLAQRSGALLNELRNEEYARRTFIDAGALCRPNGVALRGCEKLSTPKISVIPAQAGIQMTAPITLKINQLHNLDSRLRGNDGRFFSPVSINSQPLSGGRLRELVSLGVLV